MTDDHDRTLSRAQFETTHWSVVLAAGAASTVASRGALETLCRVYWPPIYAFLRRRGHSAHEAQDLTQGFFARFLEKNYLETVTPRKGKFRSYLLGAVKHYVANELDKERALKRGGDRVAFSLDFKDVEGRFSFEPRDDCTPEKTYDRCWALTLLDHVLENLRGEFCEAGRVGHFDALKGFLAAGGEPASYREVAESLKMSEGAVKVAVHRLRRRYADLLKRAVGETLADGEDTDAELRELLAALG